MRTRKLSIIERVVMRVVRSLDAWLERESERQYARTAALSNEELADAACPQNPELAAHALRTLGGD